MNNELQLGSQPGLETRGKGGRESKKFAWELQHAFADYLLRLHSIDYIDEPCPDAGTMSSSTADVSDVSQY